MANPNVLHCPEEGCTAICSQQPEMQRHLNEVHGGRITYCSVPGCKFKGVKRSSKLRAHNKEKHPELESKSGLWQDHQSSILNLILVVTLKVPEGFSGPDSGLGWRLNSGIHDRFNGWSHSQTWEDENAVYHPIGDSIDEAAFYEVPNRLYVNPTFEQTPDHFEPSLLRHRGLEQQQLQTNTTQSHVAFYRSEPSVKPSIERTTATIYQPPPRNQAFGDVSDVSGIWSFVDFGESTNAGGKRFEYEETHLTW
jgi:hypothetical protein